MENSGQEEKTVGSGPTTSFIANIRISMLLTLELHPGIQGKTTDKESAPCCHPTFILPQHQEPDEGGPLLAPWEEMQGSVGKGNGK